MKISLAKRILLLSVVIITFCTVHAQLITTIAGNGIQGYGGDGGPADSAVLYDPSSVAIDGSGNIYIADELNNRIRRVDAATGIITTVAGNGTFGYSGDGGPADSAALDYPYGIAIDGSGNIYIADQGNNCIRMVSAASGIITTVAGTGTGGYSGDGGPADSAMINQPTGVALDSSGNLYIADFFNNRIRMVAAATHTITTLAGIGTQSYSGDGGPADSAGLDWPAGVAIGGGGDVYIADSYNNRVRKIDAASGIITTVAGSGFRGYGGDGGPAIDAALNNPMSIAIDAGGDIYIADQGNNLVRMVLGSISAIITVAGTGTAAYSGDGGPAVSAALNEPVGVTLDAGGDLYIADYENDRVRMVNACLPKTDTISQYICTGGSYVFGPQVLTAAGMYIDTFINAGGCDSIVVLNLSILISDTIQALFTLLPDSQPHVWDLINECYGTSPISYTWNWGDGSPASAGDTLSHSYSSSGYYTICVTVTDSEGCSATYCDSTVYLFKNQSGQMVYVKVINQWPDGINNISTANTINLYPNPNHGSFTLETSNSIGREYTISDMLGKVVAQDVITANEQVIEVKGASEGVYTLAVKGSQPVRFVVVR